MKKILFIFGTRPEAIKMAPVIKEFKKYPDDFVVSVCVTGQHRSMLDQVLNLFKITPDYDLNLMIKNQSLSGLAGMVLLETDRIIQKVKPDWVMVQGDTTSAVMASLAGSYNKIMIGHIEAGLRTWDKYNPFPEEINRRIIDSVSNLYFAPTQLSKINLIKEGVNCERIIITGNTGIDALRQIAKNAYDWNNGPLSKIPKDKRIILATTHRRENFGKPLINICNAFKNVALQHTDVHIVIPVHMNPNVRDVVMQILGGVNNISLIEPIEYNTLANLLKRCFMVVTDSGGLQEEAPTFGKPVLVLRKISERPEGVDAGVSKVIGTEQINIELAIEELLTNSRAYKNMSHAISPYGDGYASKLIANAINLY